MKIYSNVLQSADLYATVDGVAGMYLDEVERIRNPRVRTRGWKLRTASYTSHRLGNSGKYGATGMNAASYQDHGQWFAALYAIDPNARICQYTSAEDFHKQTGNVFAAQPVA